MYARILVPLDGSALAERVLPHVEALAEKFGSVVTLLWVTTPPGPIIADTTGALPVVGGVVDAMPLVEAERREAAAYLEALAGRLRTHGHPVEYEYPEGRAAEVIVERARGLGADLIAMTTHGRGGLGRLVFGSVADAVLRNAPCPVLLVRISDEREA